MSKGETIKDLYSEIRKCLFYMIPEKWESIYLYASVIQRDNGEETGEMFFYYFPKSIIKRNPINHVTVMFKKDSILEVGNYENLPYFEDYYLWCKLIKSN